jgi:DNA-binding transcriptional regulator YdaS (Cro superfamily)
MNLNPGIIEAIKLAGGVTKLADALGISTAAVYQMRDGTIKVPAERCVQIEALTGVRSEAMRPDVDWSVLRKALPHAAPKTVVPQSSASGTHSAE